MARFDVRLIVKNLSFAARSALLAGFFPVPLPSARRELMGCGAIDQDGHLTAVVGKAVVAALQTAPKRARKHKYDAKPCFVTPECRIVLATTTTPDGKVEAVPAQDGWEWFASLHEGRRWIDLLRLQLAGQIRNLRRQIDLPLYAVTASGARVHVASLVIDFIYDDVGRGATVHEDAKGFKTDMYQLKKRWLKAQDGIDIVEVLRTPPQHHSRRTERRR